MSFFARWAALINATLHPVLNRYYLNCSLHSDVFIKTTQFEGQCNTVCHPIVSLPYHYTSCSCSRGWIELPNQRANIEAKSPCWTKWFVALIWFEKLMYGTVQCCACLCVCLCVCVDWWFTSIQQCTKRYPSHTGNSVKLTMTFSHRTTGRTPYPILFILCMQNDVEGRVKHMHCIVCTTLALTCTFW